mmetsp:Transcript_44218/g.96543  ORF Transcript_44218/g.96543 Transcript_44218/m.96543 type:complete len:208 (-) Transcript_44218:10-633(-)
MAAPSARCPSSSWPLAHDSRQPPQKGGPPKNLEPVMRTTRPLSRLERMMPPERRPWHASTTGSTRLPYVFWILSRHSEDGMHWPVLLPSTICTTMQPYVGLPSSPTAAAASLTVSSTLRSRSEGGSSRPLESRRKRFSPVKCESSDPALSTSKTHAQLLTRRRRPDGSIFAKCWPMAAIVVPEPTSPAAVTTLKTASPRSLFAAARM